MIALVSDSITDLPEGVIKMSVDESLDFIRKCPVIQFDTETTGLDPHVNKLTSMQFGYKDFQKDIITSIVVDCLSIAPELYKQVIEKSYLIGHNLKFDLEFLFNHNIVPLSLYDTMICEQTLYCGYAPGKVSYKLGDVLIRNTGIELDKAFQAEIATKGLTKEGIVYAAHDVMYLQDIRKSQMLIAKSRECLNAFTVENRTVPALAYLEWCGIKLDVKKWTHKMSVDKQQLEESLQKLNDYVKSNPKLEKFISSYSESDLWDTDGSKYKSSVTVNWSSAKQVVPIFQTLGFNTTTIDKETKEEKNTLLEKFIITQKGIDDEFLKLYFDYKGIIKNVTSYGQGHLNLINPDTGRLHTKFSQFGTVTGRMSSGFSGENKDLAKRKHLFPKDVRFVNLQNLPARGEWGEYCRSCFISEDNNAFLSCDFSAEESRVSADVWNEQSLLHAFEEGIDTHNLYAKMCFPEELKDVDVKDVKKVRPELRQAAKSAEFAVNYGSNGASIASAVGMSVEKAMEMVQGIIKGMPGMSEYKRKATNFLKKHGYIVINEITGHRIYWPEWSNWKAVEDRLDVKFYQDYALYHKGTDDDVCKMVKDHFAQGHDWFEKNVLNYPIQGGSAIVLKQAVADLFEWIVKNDYFGKILFCAFIHDEICTECPKEMASEYAKVLEHIMEKAAAKYYKRLPIPAECSIGDHWIH